jgi:sterol desaturase/sphingolipid hydroxylase (fatty acid hydroxylase superfamily)
VDSVHFSLINAAGIALILVLEARSEVFRNVLRDPVRMRRNALFLMANLAIALLLHRTVVFMTPVLPKLHWSAPLWIQLPAVFLLAELFNWVIHWAKHQNAFLWRLHCQHHRDDQYTVWLTAHTYGPEVFISGTVMAAFVIACGFHPTALDVYLLFYSLVNLYQHSARPHTLGFLDKLIVNPAYHRHHHGGAQMNYGSTLSVWDWVFGTVVWPVDRHVRINPPPISTSREPFGFVDEMLYPLIPSRWVPSAMDDERNDAAHAEPAA